MNGYREPVNIQKRRIIYMTDEEWGLLRAFAERHSRSISEVIRDTWRGVQAAEPAKPLRPSPVAFRPVPKPGKKSKA